MADTGDGARDTAEGHSDIDALASATEVAFHGVGLTGQLLPITAAYLRVRDAGSDARTEIEELWEQGTPSGRIYAAALLSEIDEDAGWAALNTLTRENPTVTAWQGCVRTTVPFRAYVKEWFPTGE